MYGLLNLFPNLHKPTIETLEQDKDYKLKYIENEKAEAMEAKENA